MDVEMGMPFPRRRPYDEKTSFSCRRFFLFLTKSVLSVIIVE